MTTEDLLVVNRLAVTFATGTGPVDAVHDVSFTLKKGEVLGIVGESGSGKTVACRSVVKLLPRTARITSGSIQFDGREIVSLSEADMIAIRGEKIAMIFQNPATHLDPLMPVGRQIGEALRQHHGLSAGEAREQSIELLRDVRIADPEKRCFAYPFELSGGMRQRVMIACALACRPDVLIADEPTTALDVTVQAEILRLLALLRREHSFAMIMVSHDLGVIAEICDRVIVMREGRIVEAGTVDDVLHRPQADYTRRLIASQPALFAVQQNVVRSGAPPDAEQAPIIALNELTVRFDHESKLLRALKLAPAPTMAAVDGVSLSVTAGSTLGIVGESGSGKSTIARAIVGLLKPAGGQILFKGQPIDGMAPSDWLAYRRAVQMVFQDPYTALNPKFTVFKTLREPLKVHRLCDEAEIPERVSELLRIVDLGPELTRRYPGQLSGGQRQRVGIARALAMQPQVIIADEVTSALDVTVQAQILELFQRLKQEMGLTLILISHDLSVVRYLSDTVGVLRRGRLIEYGPVADVLERPRESYTQNLLDSIPSLTRRLGVHGSATTPAGVEQT